MKHQCDSIFKQHTPAQASLPAHSHAASAAPHLWAKAREDAQAWVLQAGRTVCACWSPLAALALPAAPQSTTQHRLTEGDTGCAVAGTLLLGWCHKRMLPGPGGEVWGGGSCQAWGRGLPPCQYPVIHSPGGRLLDCGKFVAQGGGGEGRVQARIWLAHLPSAGVTAGLGMPVCRATANALCRRLVHGLQQQSPYNRRLLLALLFTQVPLRLG